MSKVGNSWITKVKHENFEKILSFRLKMLHSPKVGFVENIKMFDVMAGNGSPTEYSTTTSAHIMYSQYLKYQEFGKVQLILNDQDKTHVLSLIDKFKAHRDNPNGVKCMCLKDDDLYIEIGNALSEKGTFCIVNIDPNNPSQLSFRELISLLKMQKAKEMDLIINLPSTSFKRNSKAGVRLVDWVDKIRSTQPRKAWIRKQIKSDPWQWAMMAFFPVKFAPKQNSNIKGWCDIDSDDGQRAIEYFSTTNDEKKTKGQIPLPFTELTRNT